MLAFDFGLKRTGVASGELEIGVAHPLTTVTADNKAVRFAAIDRLVKEWQPVLLVVGLPSHPDGVEHEMSRAARNFAAELETRFALPVFLHDERYTSAVVEDERKHAGRTPGRNKNLAASTDALAAQLILQGFFDERATA